MNKELQALTEQINQANAAQLTYLQKQYPKGATAWFTIMSGQKNYSTGKVVGHKPTAYGGSVCIEHFEAKPRSRYRFRTIHPDSVQQINPAEGGVA